MEKSTIITYEKALERLIKMEIDYKDTNNLIERLKKKRINKSNMRLYLSAILWYYKINNINRQYFENIRVEISNINKEIMDQYGLNKLNDKEKEIYLEWGEIVNMYNKLYVNRTKSLTQFKKCITIGLYVKFPPRRIKDYNRMIAIQTEDNVNNNKNYYIISSGMFIFNNYKTKKKYGSQRFPVPIELRNLLDEYIEKYKLHDKEIINLSENDLSEKIKRIIKGNTGKGATVNTLRHSYISYMNNTGQINSTNNKKNLASMMGHSHIVQQDVYVKLP